MVLPVQATRLFTIFGLNQLWKLKIVESNWASFIFWTDRKTDRQTERSGSLDITKLKRSTLMSDIQVSCGPFYQWKIKCLL